MSLLERVNKDMIDAMKSKEKERLSVIRMLKAALQNEGIKQNTTLDEASELAVISKEVKQRRDSIVEFEKANRLDLVENLKFELTVLEAYQPKQLTEEEIRDLIAQVANELSITSGKEMGKLMVGLMPKVKGLADGGLVNKLVRDFLANL